METVRDRGGACGAPAGRAYDLVLAAFVAVLLISNVASTKILVLGPFTFDGGTILFPASYIFGDILTEVYGYRRSRRVIWAGFAATGLMAATLALVGALPPAADWPNQDAYVAILGQTPRIVLASLLAYFAGEFSNSWVLSRMKVLTGGRWLFTRTIGSTLVGEGLDTAIFVLVAFAGVLPGPLLWSVAVSNYVFKVGFEAAATPLTYLAVNRLKATEGIDTFDVGISYNPFRLSER
ncbi:MAG TPA: queuosine precursor transporter [bacterium]